MNNSVQFYFSKRKRMLCPSLEPPRLDSSFGLAWPCLNPWFGHVSRSSGLAKTILQGTMKGKRKRGRQKKRWEDNIKEWTGMDFASSTRAAENRTRWKGIVANSSVVP